jgi:hypothetical protein
MAGGGCVVAGVVLILGSGAGFITAGFFLLLFAFAITRGIANNG